VFYGTVKTLTATDTTAYQPSPIPATNGHTPTVTGRTQPMFSPAKAVAAGAIVFAVGGVLLVAQPFLQESGVPGAATDVVTEPADIVSGTQLTTTIGDPVSDEPLTGMKERSRGRTAVYEWTMDDPRLSGTVTVTRNIDRWWVGRPVDRADDMAIFWGSVSVENEDGTWAGTFLDADGGPPFEDHGGRLGGLFQLTGAGAYEGWSAILHSYKAPYSDYPPKTLLGGMVFPGDLPPDR
jgi:hypothetical protein